MASVDERARAEQFCAAAFPRLVGAMSLYVGDRAVAEELVQEAFLRAFRRWEHVGRLSSPEGWVWRVATNLANSHFRRRSAERRALQRHGPDREADSSADPAERVALQRALADLPARQREALVLRHCIGHTVEETAVRMGVSEDAVRSLTKRGIAALREEFAQEDQVRA